MLENIKFPSRLFISGIGTDVGKSFATGWLARELRRNGVNAITQKFIQTGNQDFSEDIERHRRIMGIDPEPADLDHTTAPVIFSYPASPHLAAEIDGRDIDLNVIDNATDRLEATYDCVLVEGAGGLMVPIRDRMLTIDYIASRKLPAVLVVTGQLGSLNHALLSLEAMQHRGIEVFAVVYNPFFDADDTICKSTRKYLREVLRQDFPGTHFIEMPKEI